MTFCVYACFFFYRLVAVNIVWSSDSRDRADLKPLFGQEEVPDYLAEIISSFTNRSIP